MRDDDIVDLSKPTNPGTHLLLSRRPKIVIPLDPEIAEAVLMLSDYFVFSEQQKIIEGAFSILLMSLLIEEAIAPDEVIDAFERLVSGHKLGLGQEEGSLWGEILSLASVFTDTYSHQDDVKESLEEILPSDLRVFMEECFQVRWTKGAHYLLIE